MSEGLSIEEYQKRDFRVMCRKCRRWMRFDPTRKSPAKRARKPNAHLCVECLAKEVIR